MTLCAAHAASYREAYTATRRYREAYTAAFVLCPVLSCKGRQTRQGREPIAQTQPRHTGHAHSSAYSRSTRKTNALPTHPLARLTRPANDGGEDGARSVIASEASLAHARDVDLSTTSAATSARCPPYLVSGYRLREWRLARDVGLAPIRAHIRLSCPASRVFNPSVERPGRGPSTLRPSSID